MNKYTVNFFWDSLANVWTATSDDIMGLVLESGSLDALIERVKFAAPELLALNGKDDKVLNMCFKMERHEQVSV